MQEAPDCAKAEEMKELLDLCEKLFTCKDGPPQAWFELGGKRIVYVVYAFTGPDKESLLEHAAEHLFKPLSDKGGVSLYWRCAPELTIENNRSKLWMRFAMVDKNNDAVTLPDQLKAEGRKMKEVA